MKGRVMDYVPRCSYCYRPSVAQIELPHGFWRWVFNMPRRWRYVCGQHMASRGIQHDAYK